MPLPLLICLAFASGVAAALAGRGELRVSPRAALLTQTFTAYALFLGLLLVPVTVYFYVFHAHWFLLYVVDPTRIPSAVVLVGVLALAALGGAGFLAGASLVRSQREPTAIALAGGAVVLGGLLVFLARGRVGVIGTYTQFHGGFGLDAYGRGPVFFGTLSMGLLLVLGLIFLLVRLEIAHRSR